MSIHKNTIEIRNASIKDVDEIHALETAVFDSALYPVMSRRQIRYLLTKGNADILIAQTNTDKKTIGSATIFYRTTGHYGRLYSLSVHPYHQGQSIGQLLFQAAEKAIKKKSKKGVSLELRSDNPALLGFYQKQGCIISHFIKNYYPDNMDGIRMIKVF